MWIITQSDIPGGNNVTINCDSDTVTGSDMTLTRFKKWNWHVRALDTMHSSWYQLIQPISNVIFYDFEHSYWLRRYWLSLLFGTSCIGVGNGESYTMHFTLCSTCQHIVIPWVLAGITHNIYTTSYTTSRWRCTVCYITFQLVLTLPVLILSLKQ